MHREPASSDGLKARRLVQLERRLALYGGQTGIGVRRQSRVLEDARWHGGEDHSSAECQFTDRTAEVERIGIGASDRSGAVQGHRAARRQHPRRVHREVAIDLGGVGKSHPTHPAAQNRFGSPIVDDKVSRTERQVVVNQQPAAVVGRGSRVGIGSGDRQGAGAILHERQRIAEAVRDQAREGRAGVVPPGGEGRRSRHRLHRGARDTREGADGVVETAEVESRSRHRQVIRGSCAQRRRRSREDRARVDRRPAAISVISREGLNARAGLDQRELRAKAVNNVPRKDGVLIERARGQSRIRHAIRDGRSSRTGQRADGVIETTEVERASCRREVDGRVHPKRRGRAADETAVVDRRRASVSVYAAVGLGTRAILRDAERCRAAVLDQSTEGQVIRVAKGQDGIGDPTVLHRAAGRTAVS